MLNLAFVSEIEICHQNETKSRQDAEPGWRADPGSGSRPDPAQCEDWGPRGWAHTQAPDQ